MATTLASVWGLNEKGEIVATAGTGSTNVVGYVNQDGVPLDETGKLVVAGLAVGGKGEFTSENASAARSVKTSVSVSQIRLIAANSSNNFSPRVAHAEKNRKRVTFKNPATNTVSLQLGLTQNDNMNGNQSFATSYTITPGEELACWYDENQWYARQTEVTAVANQYLIIETEVNV